MKTSFRFIVRIIMILTIATALFNRANAVQVTFQVDMTDQVVSTAGVHIAGNFQGWNPDTNVMVLQSGQIYAITFDLTAGTQAQYKFVNGNTWAGAESVPSSCALPPDNNRYLTVPDVALVLPVVCFSSCFPCSVNVHVTFKVDMTEQTVGPNGVFLAGTMNSWNTTSQPMTPVGSNIYTFTQLLPPTETYEYKFINSGAWEMVPAPCAQNANRYVLIPGADTVLSAVCFGSCNPCLPNSVADPDRVGGNEQLFYPNPATNRVWFCKKTGEHIRMSVYSADGSLVLGATTTDPSFDVSSLAKGLYFVKLEYDYGSRFSKLVIR